MNLSDLTNLQAEAVGPWHIVNCAKVLGCEPAALRAVMQVECKGSGFDRQGRPIMLFEPHIFYRVLSGEKRRAAIDAGLAYAKWGTRPYPRDSYPRLLAAMLIDEELALRSASWGIGQILGVNSHAAGYASAREMVLAFKQSEVKQLDAVARFIAANKLDGALRRKDWAKFAYGYNGPRYAVNAYDTALASAYAKFSRDTHFGEGAEVPEVEPPIPSMQRPQAAPPPTLWQRIATAFNQ
jgi:hypothetical protein